MWGRIGRWALVPGIVAAVVVAVLAGRGGTAVPAAAWAIPDATPVSEAIAFFERRLASDPGNALFMANLVGRYQQRFQLTADGSDVRRAEELARALLQRDPDPAAAHARLASVLLSRHAFGEALAEAERAVAVAPRSTGSWAVLFDAAFASGHYARAAEALARLEPGSVTWRLKSAFWLEAQGRTEDAAREARAACARIASWSVPEQAAFCWTELGAIERAGGEPRSAGALFAHALEIVPGYRPAVEGLADLARAGGDLGAAEALYRRIAVDAHPDLYLRLAEIHRARGNAGAASWWEREFLRVATEPGAEPLYGRWLALHWSGREATRDAALEVALREVERRPTVESWDTLAWVRFRRGELAAALAASDRASEWGAPSPTIEYRRGRILEGLGRHAEAARHLARAIADVDLLDPEARLDLEGRAAATTSTRRQGPPEERTISPDG